MVMQPSVRCRRLVRATFQTVSEGVFSEVALPLTAFITMGAPAPRGSTGEGGSVYETHHLAGYGGSAHDGYARRGSSGFGCRRVSGIRRGLYRFRSPTRNG